MASEIPAASYVTVIAQSRRRVAGKNLEAQQDLESVVRLFPEVEGELSRLASCPNGDGHATRSIRRCQHVATAVKNSAWVDHHARGMDFARDNTFGLDFDAALGENHAVKAPGNYHSVSLDLAFNFGPFTEDHGLLRDDVALDVAVDAKRSLYLQRAFKSHALIYKSRPLFTDTIF